MRLSQPRVFDSHLSPFPSLASLSGPRPALLDLPSMKRAVEAEEGKQAKPASHSSFDCVVCTQVFLSSSETE